VHAALSSCTFVGLLSLLPYLFANAALVYPETMGVPLEEMDAVFGEGEFVPQTRQERGLIFF
jgi:hypothetical protein